MRNPVLRLLCGLARSTCIGWQLWHSPKTSPCEHAVDTMVYNCPLYACTWCPNTHNVTVSFHSSWLRSWDDLHQTICCPSVLQATMIQLLMPPRQVHEHVYFWSITYSSTSRSVVRHCFQCCSASCSAACCWLRTTTAALPMIAGPLLQDPADCGQKWRRLSADSNSKRYFKLAREREGGRERGERERERERERDWNGSLKVKWCYGNKKEIKHLWEFHCWFWWESISTFSTLPQDHR